MANTEVSMVSGDSTDCTDLVQATKAGDEVYKLVQDLPRYFRVEDTAEKEGYSKVVSKESERLEEIREAFKKEFIGSKKLIDIIKTIVPPPVQKKYYLSYGVRLLVFQSGFSNLEELVVNLDDCIVLIPIHVSGPATGTLEENGRETPRRTAFTWEVGSELVIGGRCSIVVQQDSKAVCVVLTMGKDKE